MMLLTAVLIKLVYAGTVCVLLGLLTFAYAWAERQMFTRSQQRQGISGLRFLGISVVAADFLKLFFKHSEERGRSAGLIIALTVFLPFLFFLYLFEAFGQLDGGRGEIFLLVFIFITSIWTQKLLIFSPIQERERFSLDHGHVLLLGSTVALFLSLLPAVLITGSGSLHAIDQVQRGLPFFLMLHSPGAFVAALTGFVSLIILMRLGVASADDGQFLNESGGQSFFWIQRLWIVCVASLWVYVNLGGGPLGVFDFFSFCARLMAVLLIFLWMHVSLPRSRSGDLSRFVLRALVPLSLLAIIVELFWLAGAVRGG
jgi:NADH:ubiquinone oxidoreductase subunit H